MQEDLNLSTQQPNTPTGSSKQTLTVVLVCLVIILGLSSVILFFQNRLLKQQVAGSLASPSPSPTASTDPSVDWKTYVNPEIGFSFKYPQEWTLGTVGSRIASFNTKADTLGEFFVTYHQNVPDLSKWLLDNQAGEIINTINVNNNLFTIIKGQNLKESKEYAIKTNGNGLLRLVIEPFPNDYISDETVDQILSTFKFTDDEKVFCGGIANLPCPTEGYVCEKEGDFPDAGSRCTKNP